MAETLEYIHANGVIHRDITPSNVMIVNYGTQHARERAMLTDFGIAVETESAVFQSETITGTPAYLSPEQVRNLPLTTASDIYSLGLVLLECLTRTQAFPGIPVASAIARLKKGPDDAAGTRGRAVAIPARADDGRRSRPVDHPRPRCAASCAASCATSDPDDAPEASGEDDRGRPVLAGVLRSIHRRVSEVEQPVRGDRRRDTGRVHRDPDTR